jgi:acyl carrier protein
MDQQARPLDDRVIAFVADRTGCRATKLTLDTTLFGDLGVDGDDGVELLEAVGREFSVDMSDCHATRYFGPEGFVPWAPLYWLILAFRKGGPEQRARLQPIRISDLIRSAQLGRWDGA